MPNHSSPPRVAVFVTCLADLLRPQVGFATVKLLEAAGCRVEVPTTQTCCGQPAYNSGDRADAQALARQTIAACEGFDYVVLPSGSCAGMLRQYPALLADDPAWAARARGLADKTYELVSFLTDVIRLDRLPPVRYHRTVTYHDACSGLRELGIREQPRRLLAQVEGLRLVEMRDTEVCCGFGGTFCVKYPEISARLATDKCAAIAATGADEVLAGDLGCLLNIAGRLRRDGSPVKARHVAEVLAGLTDSPAIGEDRA